MCHKACLVCLPAQAYPQQDYHSYTSKNTGIDLQIPIRDRATLRKESEFITNFSQPDLSSICTLDAEETEKCVCNVIILLHHT